MSRTLHFFIGHFVPRRGLQYYREYLDEAGAVNGARRLGADAERRHVAAKHWALIAYLLVQSCHQLWLAFAFPAHLSARQLLLHFDLPAIEFGNVMFNIIWTALGPLSAAMFFDYYLRSDERTLALLDGILFRRQCPLFASARFRRTTPYDFLRRWAIFVIGQLQITIYLIYLIVLYYHLHTINVSFASFNVSFENLPLDLLLYRINAVKYHIFMFELAYTLILAATISGIIALSNYVMFKLAEQILLRGRRKHGGRNLARLLEHDWGRFHRFHRYFVETLRHFLYANAWTGKSFAAFLLVNFPLNAYLIMFLLVTDVPNRKKLPPILMILVQWVAVFGLHLVFSMFNMLIHRPSKPLIGLMVRQHFRSTTIDLQRKRRPTRDYIRDQIRLSHCISAFHVNNRYGHTYGKCGLVTIGTFTKCLMFYGKFMMISYKNIRKIK